MSGIVYLINGIVIVRRHAVEATNGDVCLLKRIAAPWYAIAMLRNVIVASLYRIADEKSATIINIY